MATVTDNSASTEGIVELFTLRFVAIGGGVASLSASVQTIASENSVNYAESDSPASSVDFEIVGRRRRSDRTSPEMPRRGRQTRTEACASPPCICTAREY